LRLLTRRRLLAFHLRRTLLLMFLLLPLLDTLLLLVMLLSHVLKLLLMMLLHLLSTLIVGSLLICTLTFLRLLLFHALALLVLLAVHIIELLTMLLLELRIAVRRRVPGSNRRRPVIAFGWRSVIVCRRVWLRIRRRIVRPIVIDGPVGLHVRCRSVRICRPC
jgi:hypothetical protein